MMKQIKVGVLLGGAYSRTPEYDVSLASGNLVLNNLPAGYKPVDLFVDREGFWHVQGLPATENRIKENVDVVWNALHGPFALGGGVEEKLTSLAVPYTGPIWSDAAFPISRFALNHRLRIFFFKNFPAFARATAGLNPSEPCLFSQRPFGISGRNQTSA